MSKSNPAWDRPLADMIETPTPEKCATSIYQIANLFLESTDSSAQLARENGVEAGDLIAREVKGVAFPSVVSERIQSGQIKTKADALNYILQTISNLGKNAAKKATARGEVPLTGDPIGEEPRIADRMTACSLIENPFHCRYPEGSVLREASYWLQYDLERMVPKNRHKTILELRERFELRPRLAESLYDHVLICLRDRRESA